MVIGAHRAVAGFRAFVGKWVGFSGEFGSDLGADSSLVELLFLFKETFFFLLRSLLVHSLPLPLVDASGEGSRTSAHCSGLDEAR